MAIETLAESDRQQTSTELPRSQDNAASSSPVEERSPNNETSQVSSKANKVSLASPRFWHGMRLLTFLKLMWRGRFKLHITAIPMAVAVFCYSIANSVLSFCQWIFLGRRINRTEMTSPPVFIVGHWRTGTTLVHELLNLDDQLAAPNTYQCFAPNHFLITEKLLKPVVGMLMPKYRPMDNMASGPDRPNEDEFAICALGAPSPYLRMAFPNSERVHDNLIDMKDVSDRDLEKLKQAILFFTRSLTCKNGDRRLLLKSPTHTGRIEFLRKLFPGAKFLHVCRDPESVVPSTVRLWNRLDRVNCFQLPNYEQAELEDYVVETFERMYESFDADTSEKNDDVVTLRYEDMMDDPIECLREAYQKLGLDGFEEAEPRIRDYLDGQSDYQKNRHLLSNGLREKINDHCQSYQEAYGYPKA